MMWSKNSRHHHVPLPQQQFNKIASPGGTQKSVTFLPMLCSSSTKQVKLSHRRCASSSSSSTITDEPSSPKVGCMGQVKRNNKVVGFPSIISFTSSTTSNSSNSSVNNNYNNSSSTHHHHAIKCHDQNNYYYTSNSIVKYHKIKRFFSVKSSPTSVIAAARTTVGGQGGSHKGRNGRRNNVGCRSMVDESKSCNNNNHRNRNIIKDDCNKGSLVNLVDMDPPLPVVKRVVQQQQENDGEKMGTLWKRRSGGAPLKTLRVQVIDPNNLSVNPVNTV